jgi:hypothetical protein
MSNWDDEDFDSSNVVPSIAEKVPTSWEDEEDETLKAQPEVAPGPTPAQIEAARQKAAAEEQRLQNALKFAVMDTLSPEDKKLKERKEIEEDDARIAEELFDSGNAKASTKSKASGLGAINLKNKEDHTNFGILVSSKLTNSTSFCTTAFLKEVMQRQKDTLSAESIDELLTLLQGYKQSKIQAKDLNKPPKTTQQKKEKKAAIKKHEEIFGGKYENDSKYSAYEDIEDDFM